MTKRSPAQSIAAYFAATRAMDREAWVACFHPSGASHDPVGTPPLEGHAALRAHFDAIVEHMQTVGLVEDSVYICGSRAAVKWTGRGVGKANGKPFEFQGIDIFEFDADGRIVKLEAFWDPAALMAQLA